MYEHVKTGCKHIPPSEQPLQFQSGCYMNLVKAGIWKDVCRLIHTQSVCGCESRLALQHTKRVGEHGAGGDSIFSELKQK